MKDIKQEILKHVGKKILIVGPPGSNKSKSALELAEDGHQVLFASKSNDQSDTAYAFTVNNGYHNCELIQSKQYQVKLHFELDAVTEENPIIWEPSKMLVDETKDKILREVHDMTDLQQYVFKTLFEKTAGKQFDQINKQYNLHYITHERAKIIGRNNLVEDDYYLFLDDIDLQDFLPVVKVKGNERLDKVDEVEKVVINNRFYYKRPEKYDPLYGHDDKTVVMTTTEQLTTAVIKLLYPDVVIIDMRKDMGKDDRTKIKYVLTDKTLSRYDGFLYPLSESVKGKWNHFFVGDSIGLPLNLSNIKGRNDHDDQDSLIKVSYPNKDFLKYLFDATGFKGKHHQKEVFRIFAVHLMSDKLEQALGRNQGNRWKGCESIVLLNKDYPKVIDECCYVGEVIDNLSKADVSHPMLKAIKNMSDFIKTGEFRDWVNDAKNNAANVSQFENRLQHGIDRWNEAVEKKIAKHIAMRHEKYDRTKKLVDEGMSSRDIRNTENLRRYFTTDEIDMLFISLVNNPKVHPEWVSKPLNRVSNMLL